MRDKLIELLSQYFDIGDSYAYNLTRDKRAFAIGTMSLDDFEEFDADTVADLADYLLANGVLVPPCKVGDEIWVIDRADDEAIDISCIQFLAKSKGCIIGTAWINDFDIDETIEYHINETRDNCDCALKVYPADDCFLTREEAEAALRERSDE